MSKPLLRGVKIRYNGQALWVEFRYEKMGTFCFYCSLVGHSKRNCSTRKDDAQCSFIHEGQYNDWLLADFGRLSSRPPSSAKTSASPFSPSTPTAVGGSTIANNLVFSAKALNPHGPVRTKLSIESAVEELEAPTSLVHNPDTIAPRIAFLQPNLEPSSKIILDDQGPQNPRERYWSTLC